MPRPRKTASFAYRSPRWNSTRRAWRLTIYHHHGEKDFWWPGAEAVSAPPEIVAAAVAVQDQWRELIKDWDWIRVAMERDEPEKDWSKPVWINRSAIGRIVTEINRQEAMDQKRELRSAMHTLAR